MMMMDLKKFSFIFGLIISIECYYNNNMKPSIYGENERIISSNDNLELICEGGKELNWHYPLKLMPESYSTVAITNNVIEMNTNRKYISRLNLYNASFTDTGFYYCFFNDTIFDTSNEDIDENASIYLYVRDHEHLSVNPDSLIVTSAYANEDFIIPCRPTSPDVTVDLNYSSSQSVEFWTKVQLNVNENGFIATYDPTKGFLISPQSRTTSEALYECVFTRRNERETNKHLIVTKERTYEIAIPNIEDLSKGHNIIGNVMQLNCSIKTVAFSYMGWKLPSNETVRCPTETYQGRYFTKLTETYSNTYICWLNISSLTLADKGEYKCMVMDQNRNRNEANKYVTVFDMNENYINLSENNGIYTIPVRAGKDYVQWSIDVDAHPVAQHMWYNNENKEISVGNNKYIINNTDTQAVIKIYDITINDRGYYKLKSTNGYKTKEIKLFLNVTDKPTLYIESDDYHMIKESNVFKCNVAGYPKPNIYWKCENASTKCNSRYVKSTNVKENGLALISYLNITIDGPGSVSCYANNSLGMDSSKEYIRLTDIKNGFDIFDYDKDKYDNATHRHTTVAVEHDLRLTCGVSSTNYTNQTYWYYRNYTLIENNQNMRYSIQRSFTSYSYRVTLTIRNMQRKDSGVYYCRVNRISNDLQEFDEKNITVVVLHPYKPRLISTNIDKNEFALNLPQKFEAFCMFDGLPRPHIFWLKDGVRISNSKRINMIDRNQKIVFNETHKNDEGTYTCRASNNLGYMEKHFILKFKNKEKLEPTFIIIIVVLLALLFVLFIILTIKCMKERKLKRDLKIIGLDNFEKGSPDSINPDLRIDDQAELLPYEKKWEFPREKLKLGKQLGSGAFGVVLKAKGYGILDEEESTTVAVKMVKKNADHTYIKALADELKIMIHLGKHLNVVNLLGACTGKVAKRELLVIVEFCKYGNLHNYLLRHRENFINQIDPVTETIDYNIGAEILKRTFSVSTTRSMPITPKLKYVVLSNSNSNSSNQNPKDMVDYRGNNANYTGRTAFTETTAVCMTPTGETGDDGVTLSNNSAQPEWRYNYRGDYKENEQPISTKDLIAYAFQVARGMEYLASRKVLHGDLAARNILLAENNVVKICDFGLAKTMYKNDNYKKSGSGPLPVKWMAIESIRDRIFSTQSDIWSFGIVLWEFFSLARSPYPGMEANEQLYLKLVEGYRMNAPTYATETIYNMMLDCWNVKPNMRPSFTKLAERLGNMLEDSVKKHYIDLNDPYLVMNTQRREELQTDYLDMMRPPDCEDMQSPHYYVNDMDTILNNKNQEGYMVMSPANLNTENQNGNVFNFDVNPELRPMLSVSVTDSEPPTPALSPNYGDNSIFNPSYGIAPKIEHNNDNNDSDQIVKCADNYVNMPQNKNVLRNEKISDKKQENIELPYINSNTRDWERIQV